MKIIFTRNWSSIVMIVLALAISKQTVSGHVSIHKVKFDSDPLPSWNDSDVKKSIIDFVNKTTREGSSDFIPLNDRIATFDNDGTLWAEKPLVQELFAFYRAKKMIARKPSLANLQPYKSIASGDTAYLKRMNEKAAIKFFLATQTGMTESEFVRDAKDFFATAKTPSGKTIDQLVYQPQVELLNYLRSNGFKTFICSGGSVEFIRVVSEQYYGIPPDQVIGTEFKYVFKDSANVNDIVRQPGIRTFNDKQEKPVNIQYHIGKRPVFACGNEGGAGDVYMLRFCQGGTYPSLQMIINHDDSKREFYYLEEDNKSLNWAKKYGWNVVSMKNDWKKVFIGE